MRLEMALHEHVAVVVVLRVVADVRALVRRHEQRYTAQAQGVETTQAQRGGLARPEVVEPCKPDDCAFAGQHVTVLVTDHVPILTPII